MRSTCYRGPNLWPPRNWSCAASGLVVIVRPDSVTVIFWLELRMNKLSVRDKVDRGLTLAFFVMVILAVLQEFHVHVFGFTWPRLISITLVCIVTQFIVNRRITHP